MLTHGASSRVGLKWHRNRGACQQDLFYFFGPAYFQPIAYYAMSFNLSLAPIISLIAGILILLMPRLLSTIVALYLILVGVLGLMGWQQWSM